MQNSLLPHVIAAKSNKSLSNEWLSFSSAQDRLFTSKSVGYMTYLRVELSRFRPGMNDFLVKVSTPKIDGEEKSNTLVVLRTSKEYSNPQGMERMAALVSQEMKKRGDKTHTWEGVDNKRIGKMMLQAIKIFSSNPNMELLRFSTDAV